MGHYCFLIVFGPLEPKNITFTRKIMILAINRTFLDLGPPKRYQWRPNTWANVIWGQLGGGGVSVKNRGLEGKNGFKTWILAKNGNFQSAPEGIFFNPKTFPLES